jgi:pimeloyl-ACP methyl ester carboxylesterase
VVVLVHGTPHSLVTWTDVVFAPGGLAESCDVLALDVVGHGATRTELASYTFERCARWVEGFLDALDLRAVTLVGNSYGGEFVWRAALNRPERVARIVLMSSSGFPRRDDEWLPEEVKMREMSLAKIGWLLNSRERVRFALQPHFQAPVEPERLEEVYLVCANRDNWHAMIDLARDENGLRSPELARLAQPALLLWGEKDVAYRPERFGQLFAETIPDARLVLVPNAGHYPQEEAPGFVAREIAAFARGEAR